MEEKVNIGKDKNGMLIYKTSRGGKMYDISLELRAKAINLNEMIKKLKPIYKNLYIIKHKIIVPMARMEDKDIDLIYLNSNNNQAIFVHPKAHVFWNNKKI
jgi:agmatine/peptidylarginine deiminase